MIRPNGTTTASVFRRLALGLTLGLALPMAVSACTGGAKMGELEVPAEGVALRYDLVPGSIFEGTIASKRSDGSVGGNQSTRKLDIKAELTVMGQREDGATQLDIVIKEIAVGWVVPNSPVNLESFVENAKTRLRGMKISMFLAPTGEVVEFPGVPDDLPQEDQFLMELVLDGIEQAFYPVPERPLKKGESWDDERERGRKGKLGRYYKETTTSTFEGLFAPDTPPPARVARLDVDAERIETITTKEGGHETKYVDEKAIVFDIDANFLSSMEGKRTKYDGDAVSRMEFRASWRSTDKAAVAQTVKQTIADPCSDDYVGGEDCTDPCSSNYLGEEACTPEGETPAEAVTDEATEGAATESAAEGAAESADEQPESE